MVVDKNQKNFFKVVCADWTRLIFSNTPEEAVSKALQDVVNKKGEKAHLSFFISAEEYKIEDPELFLYETSFVLSDLGYFKLSKNLSSLSDFFLDKGKNPH